MSNGLAIAMKRCRWHVLDQLAQYVSTPALFLDATACNSLRLQEPSRRLARTLDLSTVRVLPLFAKRRSRWARRSHAREPAECMSQVLGLLGELRSCRFFRIGPRC